MVGKPKPHDSALGHVKGAASYTDDQRLPSGMLSLWPVLSPYAHAHLLSLDFEEALALPGVITVLTHKDVIGENDSGAVVHDEVLLPVDQVFYCGQPVAWVVAESEDAARLGAAAVKADYEELSAVLTIKAAIQQSSFHGESQRMSKGDVTAALSEAEHGLAGEVEVGGQDHFYLETQATWVIPDGEGNYQVTSSTQHPSETQIVVARVLGIPSSRVVVTSLRMGGGFGGKETQANPYAAVAALAAYKTGKPVRVRLKRDLDMVLTGKRHPFLGVYKVGFDAEGRLAGLELDLYSDGGWSTDLSHAVLQRAMFHSDNAYCVPHMSVRGQVCKTNKTSQTAFRGFGGPQGMVVVESILARVAAHLKLPPELVRERNFYQDGDVTHYGQTLSDVRVKRIWQTLRTSAELDKRKLELATFNASSPHLKRGLAITPVKFGISFTTTFLNQAGAFVLIYADGSVQLNHGGTEMGQGLHVKMLQIAAQTLGVPLSRIRMMPTATDKVPNTSATAASSGADLNGQAVRDACETLKSRLSEVAASMLKAGAESVIFEEDAVFSEGDPNTRLSFAEVVGQAYLSQVSLSATGFYRTPNIYFNKQKGQGKPFHYYAYGASVSEVEIDSFTGTYNLRRVDILHDVGDSLNPLIDRGQIEGGFVQGMGWLTTEELVWDESGRLRTHAPSTYKIPTVSEVPETFNVSLLEQAKQDSVIHGSKAVGEPPFMLAISVREALRDAASAFGSAGAYAELPAPATPEAVLMTVESLRAEQLEPELVPGD